MNVEQFQAYCLSKPATSENFPFDEVTLALRVGGKIFALTGLDNERFSVNLKCDPEQGETWREQYSEVQPGYHMNKKHWNTVDFEGTLSDKLLKEMIDHSYDMVVKGMTKKERAAMGV